MEKITKLHIVCGLALAAVGGILRIFYMMFLPTFMIIAGVAWTLYGAVGAFAERGVRLAVWLRFAYRIGLVCVAVSFVIIQGVIILNDDTDARGDEKYIIALGAGLYGDVPSMVMQSRMDALEEYMKDNPQAIAIVTGGQGDIETITEAEAFRRSLEDAGIPASRIIIEDKALNTAQNLEYSARIIKEREGSLDVSCAVLTNEFHLWRGKCLAKSVGLDATGIAVKSPRLDLLLQYHLREYFSVVKMLIGLGGWDFSF